MRAGTLSLHGLLLGGLASAFGVAGQGWSVLTGILVAGGCWALAFFVPLALSALGGAAGAQIHAPSGRTTPSRREYSHAESLVARGLYQEAIDAFELATLEDPADPTPYLRIARINRDHLGRNEEAARWLKKALGAPGAHAGAAYLATRELVELYINKLGEPARAAPLLARLAEERAGTVEGDWAAAELAHVKASMREDS